MQIEERQHLMSGLEAFVTAAAWLTDHADLDDPAGRLQRWVI
jgi:hypothetical protein